MCLTCLLPLFLFASSCRSLPAQPDSQVAKIAEPGKELLSQEHRENVAIPSQDVELTPEQKKLPTLSGVAAVRQLSNSQARLGYPVQLRGTLTYFDSSRNILFVQDLTAGILVQLRGQTPQLEIGQRLEVSGTTTVIDEAPAIINPRLTPLGSHSLPVLQQASLDHSAARKQNGQWVETQGVIHAIGVENDQAILTIVSGNSRFKAKIPNYKDRQMPINLVDAEVRVRGVSRTIFNSQKQSIGFEILMQSIDQITVLKEAPADLFAIPVRQIDSLMRFTEEDSSNRVKIEGIVTLRRPGRALFIQDETGGIYAWTEQNDHIQPGDRVEALGYIFTEDSFPALDDTVVRKLSSGAAPAPVSTTPKEILTGKYDSMLVQLEGRLVNHAILPNEQQLVVQSEDVSFNATLQGIVGGEKLSALQDGSLMRVVGVCAIRVDDKNVPKSFVIYPRSPEDVVVMQSPSWWTFSHLFWVIAGMAILTLLVIGWVVVLQRRVRQQTKTIHQKLKSEAALEQRYSDLFENANDIIYTHDLQGNYTSINKAGEKITGYTYQESLSMNVIQMVAPEYIELVKKMQAQKMVENAPSTYELEIITKDGHRTALEINSRLIYQGGSPIGVQGIARDITERKRAEAERQVTSELIQGVIAISNLDELFHLFHDSIKKILYAENCFIALYNFTTDLIKFEFWVDQTDTVPPPSMIGNNLCSFVLANGQPLLLTDKLEIQIYQQGKVKMSGTQPASWMGVPLRTSTRTIGVLVVQHYEKENAYNQRDLEFLASIGDHLAIVIERKQIEIELKTTAIQLMESQQIAAQGSWEWDVASNELRWSDELFRIFGFHPQEFSMTFERFIARIHPDDRNRVGSIIEKAAYDKVFPGYDCRIVWEDGTVRAIQSAGKVIVDEHGCILKMVGTSLDVTERKQADMMLRKIEEKYRNIIERIGDGYFEVDLKGNFTFFNDALCVMFGYSPKELMGMNYRQYTEPEAVQKLHKIFNEVYQTGKSYAGYGYRIFKKDGTPRFVESSATLIRDADGLPVGFLGILRDITQRKQIEEALKLSEERYRTIIEEMTDSYWEVDLDANFTFFNNQVMVEQQRSREELLALNKHNSPHIDRENARKISKVYHQIYLTGEAVRGLTFEMTRGDGAKYTIEANVSLIKDKEGKPTGFRGISRDVTNRIQVENELQAAKEAAEAANRAKSEFLANMSHEIRTPMNGVIGMTGLLLDTQLNDDQREFAETIRASGDALLTIINDILDFSKIEAGKLQFENLDFDLNNAVEGTVDLLAERAFEKKIEFASLIYSDVPVKLRGDPGRLRQVLTNLISNAIKFTEHGEVIVKATKQSETNETVNIRFTVSDTGIGMTEVVRQRLFQPFMQADGSTTRKYGGTGLGLAISKQLVELMGGEIGISSEPGKGSTFWFTARFGKQTEIISLAQPMVANLNNLRVLIVDDNATNRKILSHQFSSWRMIYEEADSGALALDVLRQASQQGTPYDLAVLDLMMPGMDGFELARTIKSDPKIAEVTLVLLTSYGQRGHAALAREAGIAAYLAKPVRKSQLFDCLTDVMNQGAVKRRSKDLSGDETLQIVTRRSLQEEPKVATKLILLAEDNIVNQKIAVRQLQKLGYRADAVANGNEALEALGRIHYDLVLMDCQMPEMDGYEATAEIRRREGVGRHTLIVAMTANALEGDREKCIAAGMDDYVSKPVRSRVLGDILERLLVDDR